MEDLDLVLTAIGSDRPGLVEALSDTIARHGGNWLESRMARMSGQFAGIVQVRISTTRLDELEQALGALATRGLSVQCTRTQGLCETDSPVRWVDISLVGRDRQGIVRDVSAVLSRMAVNVDELETELTHGAMSGENLFRASARLTVPAELAIDELRKQLEQVADDLMVDLQLLDAAPTDQG